jgi:alkanesulfonate monooxygenase
VTAFDVLWTLPSREAKPQRRFHRSVRDERPGRFTYADYAVQVARAADLAGFHGLLLPSDPAGEEPWILGSALARETRHLRIVPEFSPESASAVYSAKLAFTFQRFFNERLGWLLQVNDVPGDAPEDRFLRAEELLIVAEGVWGETPFDFTGRFFSVAGGALFALHPTQHVRAGLRRFPTVYARGEDDRSLAFSARHADVHLFDELEPRTLAGLVGRHRRLAADAGRVVRYGVRVPIVARDDAAEARAERDRLIEAGYTYRAALTGSYTDVAKRLLDFGHIGIGTFVFDSAPRLEEAYRLGEYLLPLLESSTLERAVS